MSNRNWTKHTRRERMDRHGTEERDTGANLPPVIGLRRAPAMSKEELRRQADRLLAGYTGPVTKLSAGLRVTGSQVSGDFPRSVTGIVSSQPSADRPQISTFRSNRKVEGATQKGLKSKGDRVQGDLFGATRKSVTNRNAFDRAVPPGLTIYCDGACEPNPGAGGWGFVVYRDGVEIDLGCGGAENTTNQRMELKAAIEALICMRNIGEEYFRLFSDSQYVVKGSNEWRHGWKAKGWRRKGDGARAANQAIANLDLWQMLDRLLTEVPVCLEWCKGHAGIIGNERADELSLEGRESVLALQPDPADLIEDQLRYVV